MTAATSTAPTITARALSELSDAQIDFVLTGNRQPGLIDDINRLEWAKYLDDMPTLKAEARKRGIAVDDPQITVRPNAAARPAHDAGLVDRLIDRLSPSKRSALTKLKKATAAEAAGMKLIEQIKSVGDDPRVREAQTREAAYRARLGTLDAEEGTYPQRYRAVVDALEAVRVKELIGEATFADVEAKERELSKLDREASTRATAREALTRAIAEQRRLVETVTDHVLGELGPAVATARRELLQAAARDLIRFSRSNNLLIEIDRVASGFTVAPVGGFHTAALCTLERPDDYMGHPHGQSLASMWLRDVRSAGIDVQED